jgi:hypothetical protein
MVQQRSVTILGCFDTLDEVGELLHVLPFDFF